MGEEVLAEIEALIRRKHNIMPREMEAVAVEAGYTLARITGSHKMYVKEGVRRPLPIPRHSKAMNGYVARRLLRSMRESLEGANS